MKWSLSELKHSRLAKVTLGIGIVWLSYTLIGFVLLPALIKWQMLKRLPAITQRAVTVRQVKLNPFALSLTIRGVALQEPNGDVSGSFDELSANLKVAAIFQRAWVFKEIRLIKPFGNVSVLADGKFNCTNRVSVMPRIVVERLDIEAGTLLVGDGPRHRQLKLSHIAVQLDGLSSLTHAAVATTLSLLCNETGTVALQGTVRPFAHSADVQVQVTDLDLRALQPYVGEIWKLEITGGALSATGRVQYAAAGPAAPLVQFTGTLGVANFTSVDSVAHEEFLKLDALTLAGLDLHYLPHRLDVAVVNVVGLRSSVFIRADKTSNWRDMLISAEKLHALLVKLQLNKLFPFQIGTLAFDNGSVGFADRAIQPHVVAEIQEVAGRVTGLSSTRKATATVDLHGKVDGHSTFTIAGTLHPLADDLKLDLVLSLKNGKLTPGSPYAAKYAGYPIHQGQLSVEAHYAINQQTLQAEHKVRLQQLRLGAKSNSPDATQLPVKLAIALLQDRDGVLTFDVPVNGHLDDPQFQFGPVVTEVLLSIITKAVSNPFALLGSLFGGGEQLSFVNFAPGGADFAAGETRKLDTLAKALAARPALELEITGSADTTNDRLALAISKLHPFKAGGLNEITAPRTTAIAVQVHNTIPVVTTSLLPSTEPPQNFSPRKPSSSQGYTSTDTQLIDTIDVTPDDFQALMQARAEKVQQYLVHTGHVAVERLFIAPPKPVNPSSQGQSRVELSLQ